MNDQSVYDLLKQMDPQYEKTWRASDDLIEALPAILRDYLPARILEFGPGLSSYVFYHYNLHVPGSVYVGIDDDNPYARSHQMKLAEAGFMAGHTHVCSLNLLDGWYNVPLSLMEAFEPFDLIMIDGPGSDRSRVCPRALACYEQMSDPKRTIWIVDDSTRPASGWLSGQWIPEHLQAYTSTVIYDRNYPRTTTIILPYDLKPMQ